ncbi:IclR family transcriptional regulator [Ktedonosporobacter rubrisoli]|uniref:IclR family transcriptional regulator n=1 Tax=Ktedonosporobacter rubrisoli TaxID=2509675 RepID=A0A4P6JNE6_KTERU|nr:IclR family transcriptional regulator [Ktedonosporobacter rubrisoli]QBD76683.1 IclR family transcriptional regulator [Ktedonosporobacter rubrisoli]
MRYMMEKVGHVLDLFSFKHPEWGVSEISQTLAIPKSTTSEIMASLATQGLLARTEVGRYRLGWRLFHLSQVLLDNTDFCIEARQVMRELVERWGETSHLAVLDKGQVLYVEKLQGTPAVQILLSQIGGRLPPHCSGVGKVLLAQRSWHEVTSMLEEQELKPFTPHTITSFERLAQELEEVRKHGYAFDHEEVAVGLCCVAAPIYDQDGHVLAAMSISVPAYRFYPKQDTYMGIILKAAHCVSESLGYRKEKPKS